MDLLISNNAGETDFVQRQEDIHSTRCDQDRPRNANPSLNSLSSQAERARVERQVRYPFHDAPARCTDENAD